MINPHANLPHAEAKIQVCNFGTENWRDSLDFDPVMLPVEDTNTTDVFSSRVTALMNGLIAAETDADGFSGPMPKYVYRLVWSRSDDPVKGVCPVCDEQFIISEGMIGDGYDEGDNAVWCGCTDED